MDRGTCRFGPAAPDEPTVHGACRPGHGPRGTPNGSVGGWISFVQREGIERVCCLLSDRQLRRYDGLLDRYGTAFGRDHVRHVAVPDHSFVDRAALDGEILPFLRAADGAGEPVVVHCWAGVGRTGHVLALWLSRERGYDLDDAVATVRRMGRRPLEAAGSDVAGRDRLRELL